MTRLLNQVSKSLEPTSRAVTDSESQLLRSFRRTLPDMPSRPAVLEGYFAESRSSAWRRRMWTAVFLIVPTVIAALYCFLWAAPLYQTSVRFLIRGSAESNQSALSKLLPGGSSGTITDGFAVRDYLTSFEALSQLDKRIGYLSRMQAPRGDFLLRLPTDASREEQMAFFHDMAKGRYNMMEGILTLDVYGYTPQDAHAVAEEMVTLAEEFSNELNRRATEDSLRTATETVNASEQRLSEARTKLNEWRKANSKLDLEQNAKTIDESIGKLQQKVLEARTELGTLINASPNSPRRTALQEQIASLQEQIEAESARLIGSSDNSSVVNLLVDYQDLSLTQEYASKEYELSLQALHNARVVASTQQKYIVPIGDAMEPQRASWPDPRTLIPLTFLITLLVFWIGKMTVSVVRESRGR